MNNFSYYLKTNQMYFSGNLSVDPKELTNIVKVKPQKAFKRILFFLTAGAITDKEEQETFSAVSILQQLYQVFSGMGIHNLVRLSHDDINFYLDEEGKNNDLKNTLDKYELETNEAMSKRFSKLNMVLEHQDANMKYLINISINRTHEVGVYPIDIFVDGLLSNFACTDDASSELVQNKLSKVFESQESYNAFMLQTQANFDQFLNNIKYELTKTIRIEDVRIQSSAKILIPKEAQPNAATLKEKFGQGKQRFQAQSPIYHGYYGTSNSFFYAFLWADVCANHSIHVNNSVLVSEDGFDMMNIGEEGINTGENSLFDLDQDFSSRLSDNGLGMDNNSGEIFENSSSDGGWFDFGGDADGGGDSGCSSCSSCGGCGGCGG